MLSTLVIQSHRSPIPYPWLNRCLESVRTWSEDNGYQYQFLGDELFDLVSDKIIKKTQDQKVIATDLARLLVMQKALSEGVDRVVWLDADFLIFDPINFVLTQESYAVGREVWVQLDNKKKLRAFKKVHNAFLMFQQGNVFLEFYIETASKLILQNKGAMPPQFIGPKLLTALHNIALFPVMECAGMLSPLVIKNIVCGGGDALRLFLEKSMQTISGANICCSSIENEQLSELIVVDLVNTLLSANKIC